MAERVAPSRKMLTNPKCLFAVLQLSLVCLSRAFEYEFLLEKDGLMAPCESHPGNTSGLDALFDMSTLKITQKAEATLQLTGDTAIVWQDVEPSDTITMLGQIYQLDQGSWQKTMFSASSKNFCRNMFEKNQYWYKFWTQNIINSKDVRKTCLNTRGSQVKHESYELDLKASVNVPNLGGRYKLVVLFEAFDKRNVKRPVSICSEFRGIIRRV